MEVGRQVMHPVALQTHLTQRTELLPLQASGTHWVEGLMSILHETVGFDSRVDICTVGGGDACPAKSALKSIFPLVVFYKEII